MSMLGIDTTQLISKFTTSESQQEWGDVEKALQKAFPDQSMEEIHARATIYVGKNPDATIGDVIQALSAEFSVSISTELAAEIRSEWDEFNQASGLDPAELLAVLDDYSGDSVNTHSRAYLMFMVQALQQEIERLTAETMEKGQEADKAQYEQAKAELNEKIEEMNKPKGFFDKIMPWLSAAAAVIGAAIAVAVAVAVTVATGGVAGALAITAAVIACVLAVSAVAGAASGGEYSLAGLTAKLLEACGVDEQTAQWIGIGLEITLAVVGICCSLGAGFASAGGTAASTATNTATTATKVADTTAKVADGMSKFTKVLNFVNGALMVTSGVVTGAKAIVDYEYAMEQADLMELKAMLEKMLAILKASQQINEKLLEAIFSSMRNMIIENQEEYLDVLQNTANVDMA